MESARIQLVDGSLGDSDALVLIRGFLSAQKDDVGAQMGWARAVRAAGWRGTVYELQWDSLTGEEIHAGVGIPWQVKLAVALNPFSAPLLLPQLMLSLATSANAVFAKAERHSDAVAAGDFWRLLASLKHPRLSLLGFSLGARLLIRGATLLPSTVVLRDIVLAGAAVSDREFGSVAEGLRGRITGRFMHLFGYNDFVLTDLFGTGRLCGLSQPLGTRPFMTDRMPSLPVDCLRPSFTSIVEFPGDLLNAFDSHSTSYQKSLRDSNLWSNDGT